ncbi:MAG: hypothetical protein B7Y51_11100 [Burkholderiales bacterium 28-67-8]|nr:MAG: hypothetical protein B7Y51_11100 [Burkholderiales bacterium 28-67-8]
MNDSNDGLIQSRGEYQAALLQAFALIAESSASEIWMCDADFADWPLNEPQVVEQLTRWSVAHRRCHVLALNYDSMPRRHPRWVHWRRHWAHVVTCMTPDDSSHGRLPGLLFAPGVVSVRLVDRVHYRGRISTDVDDAVRLREELDALFQRSVEAFPASTLGL